MEQARLFFFFSDTPRRREVLRREPDGSPVRDYLLYGLPSLRAAGYAVRHNLAGSERKTTATGRLLARANRWLHRAGGYGGDFQTVFENRRAANAADLVVSTVDNVGIPLVLARRWGGIRPPLLYVSIGLPERILRIRAGRWRERYRRLFAGQVRRFIAYGYAEAEWLRRWLAEGGDAPPVSFVPFGVRVDYFSPEAVAVEPDGDVLSVGRDVQRDLSLLLDVARAMPERMFRVVTGSEHRERFRAAPPNMIVEYDLDLDTVRERYARSRVVLLPVRENTYSGATTTLLQAMAMGRPVVVSRVGAIREGYGLRDGENCRLVPPGDVETARRAVTDLLQDRHAAEALGARARRHVCRTLSWDHYLGRMRGIIDEALTEATA